MTQQQERASRASVGPAAEPDPVPAMDILSTITASLAGEDDLEALLERFLGTIVVLAGARGGAVRVLANNGLEMRLVGSVGVPAEVIRRELVVRHDCGICGPGTFPMSRKSCARRAISCPMKS